MKTLIYVFIGGGVGASMRYGISLFSPLHLYRFPWATLLANVIAALVLGWIVQSSAKSSDPLRYVLLATGFCGGLSTFSTFSLETIQFFQRGDIGMAILNIALNILLSLWALWLFVAAAPLGKT